MDSSAINMTTKRGYGLKDAPSHRCVGVYTVVDLVAKLGTPDPLDTVDKGNLTIVQPGHAWRHSDCPLA